MPVTDPKAPSVVSRDEQMNKYPPPGAYVTISLLAAKRKLLSIAPDQDYRIVFPEVYLLGGINLPRGVVIDLENRDVLVFGQYYPDRQPLTLDDLVVALRARFIWKTWPVVSIDPGATPWTQDVRFEGGIEDTQFGADLLEADYRLKEILQGLLAPGVPGIESLWSLREKYPDFAPEDQRFWFDPVSFNVVVRENVAVIKDIRIRTSAEVRSDGNRRVRFPSSHEADLGQKFAAAMTANFEKLAKVHPYFSRVQILAEVVHLAVAIEALDKRGELAFWLENYKVKQVPTRKTVNILWRKGLRTKYTVHLSYGGIELRALAWRARSGDAVTLRNMVLQSRTSAEAFSWVFIASESLIRLEPLELYVEDVEQTLNEARLMLGRGDSSSALALYTTIIDVVPGSFEANYERGLAYQLIGSHDLAVRDLGTAIQLNPGSDLGYASRGASYSEQQKYGVALKDLTMALSIKADKTNYIGRGIIYGKSGRFKAAIQDLSEAVRLDGTSPVAYFYRGVALSSDGQYDRALSDFDQAIALDSQMVSAFYCRALAYEAAGKATEAMADYRSYLAMIKQFAALRVGQQDFSHAPQTRADGKGLQFPDLTKDAEARLRSLSQGTFPSAINPSSPTLGSMPQEPIPPSFFQIMLSPATEHVYLEAERVVDLWNKVLRDAITRSIFRRNYRRL